jgi:hypothetical protein
MPVHQNNFAVLQMKYLAVFRFDGAVDLDNRAVRKRNFLNHRGGGMPRFHHHHFPAVHHHAVHLGGGREKRQRQKDRRNRIDDRAQELRATVNSYIPGIGAFLPT